MLLLCAQPRSFSESVKDFPSCVRLSRGSLVASPVPRVPSINWHFLKETFFGLFFSIKGKNRHQTCPGASLGCFTPGEGIPVHKILKAGRVLAFPRHHHNPVTYHLNLVPRHHRIKILLLLSCRTGWAWLPHLRERPDGPS